MAPRHSERTAHKLRLVGSLLICILAIAAAAAAQSAKIYYRYDELHRLIGVIDQQGNVATYTYDAVGNLLKIERFDSLPGPVSISYVTPNRGVVGATVAIYGKGFSATASQNTVAFNGTPATIITSAAPNRIMVKVPPGATTGSITIATPLGSGTSPTPFRVIGVIAITPAGDFLHPGASRQFAASDDANPGMTFTWSVNAVLGGNATVGTVTSSGLYTAPASVPTPPAVTLTVAEMDDPSLTGSAQVLIYTTPFASMAAAQGLSVRVQPAPSTPQATSAAVVSVNVQPAAASQPATTGARPVAVQFQAPAGSPQATSSVAPVSVKVQAPTTSPQATSSVAPVSVKVQSSTTPAQATSSVAPVSLRVQAAQSPASQTAPTAGTAVTFEPFIRAVSPASAAAGTSNLTVTVTGSGLTGATGVTFLRNNASDSTISVTNLIVNGGGTQATITLSVAAGAPAGGRVVQITTPGRTSTAAGLGGNVFTVQ